MYSAIEDRAISSALFAFDFASASAFNFASVSELVAWFELDFSSSSSLDDGSVVSRSSCSMTCCRVGFCTSMRWVCYHLEI